MRNVAVLKLRQRSVVYLRSSTWGMGCNVGIYQLRAPKCVVAAPTCKEATVTPPRALRLGIYTVVAVLA